jgi:hypothetical protein
VRPTETNYPSEAKVMYKDQRDALVKPSRFVVCLPVNPAKKTMEAETKCYVDMRDMIAPIKVPYKVRIAMRTGFAKANSRLHTPTRTGNRRSLFDAHVQQPIPHTFKAPFLGLHYGRVVEPHRRIHLGCDQIYGSLQVRVSIWNRPLKDDNHLEYLGR